jgi:hypothetical protein
MFRCGAEQCAAGIAAIHDLDAGERRSSRSMDNGITDKGG